MSGVCLGGCTWSHGMGESSPLASQTEAFSLSTCGDVTAFAPHTATTDLAGSFNLTAPGNETMEDFLLACYLLFRSGRRCR
jgi:hypothetical protein